jgi:DNA repair protein RadA/Sms
MRKKASKTVFICQACGAEAPRWLGKCAGCGAWNSLAEERVESGPRPSAASSSSVGPVPLGEVRAEDAQRLPTGIAELDRALGGGAVAGGVCLLGGDPGIGKSTLLMQALASLAAGGHEVLYVTGEESASQIALRGERIGGAGMRDVHVLATTTLGPVLDALRRGRFRAVVIDSIQTLRDPGLDSAAGTVSQLREVTTQLIDHAKARGVAMFLIGHVTKEGTLAGPKVLEHLVDTVLAFEGDPTFAFRLVRAVKNRFGPAHELGVFEMVQDGLREVPDPSALFLAERPSGAAGSVVVPTAEGSRPVLVEVQALVAPAVYGAARRVASGIEPSRLAILLAVLDRKVDVHVLDQDVFASVAGGARVSERATDLAVALSVVSSLRDRPVPADLCAFGEVGLAGEVRAVPRPQGRIAEARKLGFKTVIAPRTSAERLTADERRGVEVIGVDRLEQALEAALH